MATNKKVFKYTKTEIESMIAEVKSELKNTESLPDGLFKESCLNNEHKLLKNFESYLEYIRNGYDYVYVVEGRILPYEIGDMIFSK